MSEIAPRMNDHPTVGVCPWREWTQEAACWIMDPHKGNFPSARAGWLRYRHILRSVRQKPFKANPWRRYFARYSMTPWEAFCTMRKAQSRSSG
jgi:hypothetical protein